MTAPSNHVVTRLQFEMKALSERYLVSLAGEKGNCACGETVGVREISDCSSAATGSKTGGFVSLKAEVSGVAVSHSAFPSYSVQMLSKEMAIMASYDMLAVKFADALLEAMAVGMRHQLIIWATLAVSSM